MPDPYWTKARFTTHCSGRKCQQAITTGEEIFYYPAGRDGRRAAAFAVACGCAERNAADFHDAAEAEDYYNM